MEEKLKKKIEEIEKKTGIKIDPKIFIKKVLDKKLIKGGINKILNATNEMLKEGANNYVEVGSKNVGKIKIDHGIRIGFLDDKKDKKINWIKKKKK